MSNSPLISILIPAYNEHQTLGILLDLLYNRSYSFSYEILIIDDGSEPPLRPLVQNYLDRHSELRYYRLLRNAGKGSAIQVGLKHAKGEYILIQDADLEYLPRDIPHLIKPILDHSNTAVYGNRFPLLQGKMKKTHMMGNRILTGFMNFLFLLHLHDIETGYKLIPRQILLSKPLIGTEFEIELELTHLLLANRTKIIEVPITYHYRSKGITKITIIDAVEAVLFLVIQRFFSSNSVWHNLFRFFKKNVKPILTKILRIMAPAL